MSTITSPHALRLAVIDPQPPCPSCSVALHAATSGRRRYWSCRTCGTTMPRF